MPKNGKLLNGAARASGDIGYTTTLADARDVFDAIIVVTPTQDFVSRTHMVTYMPAEPGDSGSGGFVDSEWTEGPVTVNRVLFQKPGHTLTAGQNMTMVEPVGLVVDGQNAYRSVIENSFEIKQNSQYVLFIIRGTDGVYAIDNFNLGRFNTDGTDCNDERGVNNGTYSNGAKTDKQKLRDELTAQYGIAFAPMGPCQAPPSNISASVLGIPRGDGITAIIYVTITPPQPGNSMLEIQQSYAAAGPWAQVTLVPVIASAQTGTTPVRQEVDVRQLSGSFVRYRIVNGTPSDWSAPAPVRRGL